jgi:hypothetical protein
MLVALLFLLATPQRVEKPATPPALGIGVNVSDPNAEAGQAALDMVRRTGATFFALEVSWSAVEPKPHEYRLEDITRSARLLRQSGATLHLTIPLVTESARDVPSDLAETAFDDPKLSLRLGRLLDALMPVLLDVQTLSLGEAADTYFADKPDELRAYRRLFDGAVQFLQKKAPRLLVGVTTSAPTESRSPEVAAELHRRSPALFYSYCPLVARTPFTQRDPEVLEKDWDALLAAAGGRPIAFPRVSYSSSAENGSSPAKQADFIRIFRRFVSRADGRKLLFARYLWLRDPVPSALPEVAPGASVAERRRHALFGNLGLQDAAGHPKPAWAEWLRESAGVKR